MSEQTPWNSILAISGVVIGFLLSQLGGSIKSWRKRQMVKKAMVNELSIIRETFSDALKSGENRIPDEHYPFITETYDSVRLELASFMKSDSLAIVQRTYEEIRKLKSEGRGHIVIAGSLDHIFQFTDFNKLTTLIDDSVARLK